MDFCMRLASEVIVKEINENPEKNFVLSPLSLNCLLNMVASGAKGDTLKQLLQFLESESIADVNVKSSKMIDLATITGEPNREEEPISASNQYSSDNCQQQKPKSDFVHNQNWVYPQPIKYRPMMPPAPANGEFSQTFQLSNQPSMVYHYPGSGRSMPPSLMNNEECYLENSWMMPSRRKGESSSQKGPELSFIGGIWMDHRFPIKPSFKQITKDVYKAESKTVDFKKAEQVRKEVNLWAEKETKGLVKDLIPSDLITQTTVSILANALYFKGQWCFPFETSRTGHEAFYLLNQTTGKVPFMKTNNKLHFYASFGGCKILKLPYASGQDKKRFSMYIFLPHENDGLQEFMQNLNSQSIFLRKDLPLQEMVLSKVWIPKFKFSYGFDAKKFSTKLGLTLPFEMVGDFTEMVDSPISKQIYVSHMLHKSFIEVNEEGTEAAAASCAFMSPGCSNLCSLPLPLPSFVADHPFMFMIKEEVSGAVFFAGTVLNPSKED